MAGIMIASKTEHNTTMLRLIHEGKIIDRMEVESLIFLPEEEVVNLSEKDLINTLINIITLLCK